MARKEVPVSKADGRTVKKRMVEADSKAPREAQAEVLASGSILMKVNTV